MLRLRLRQVSRLCSTSHMHGDPSHPCWPGTNRVREAQQLPTDQGKQPRLQPARPVHGVVAAAADAGRASQQEACELQYATLAQSVANGPVLKSLVVSAMPFPYFCPQHSRLCITPFIDRHSLGLQPAGLQASLSVDMLLESVVKTNIRVADARTAIASRVHNKVFLLENPAAALSTKPKRGKHNKQLSTQLLGRKQRPALGTNHKYAIKMRRTAATCITPHVHQLLVDVTALFGILTSICRSRNECQ